MRPLRLVLTTVLAVTLGLGSLATGARAAEDVQLRAICDGGGVPGVIEAMENEYIEGTGYGGCWFHTGHHTYDLGGVHEIGEILGSLVSVEIVFSPSTEFAPDVKVVAETSVDGLAWELAHRIRYQDRKRVRFGFDGEGRLARYVRLRQPRSAAQGLSGFLDSSEMTITARPCDDCAPPAPTPVALTCAEHVMERFFAEHPCWTGGINRYDSPSVFHTYPLLNASPARVTGTATFLPWRTDDYSGGGGSRTEVTGYLQVSADAVHWTTAATTRGIYGTSLAFDSGPLPGAIAYARFVAEYHAAVKNHPALKHARGFVVDSSLALHATT